MSDTDTTAPATDQPQAARAPVEPAPTPTNPTPAPEATLGDGGKKALDAERSARRAAEKAAAEALAKVKQFEDRDKTELEKLTDQISKAKAEADQARAEALRLRVAAESGLPADLHEFLVGNDEEDLRSKAQKLMAATAAATDPRRPAPDPTQGAKPGSGDGQITKADLARMTPQQIVDAQNAGRLDDLMAGRI